LVHPKKHTLEEVGILRELKNLCVKIPLLEAIKDVPIYNKKECFKGYGRRRRDTPKINVVGQLYHLMLGSNLIQSTWTLVV